MTTESNFDHRAMLEPKQIDPCPFCGGDASVREGQMFGQNTVFVRCGQCGAGTREFTGDTLLEYAPNAWAGTGKLRAAAAWNTRPGQGTFACPQCGVDVPHTHKPASESHWGKLEVVLVSSDPGRPVPKHGSSGP